MTAAPLRREVLDEAPLLVWVLVPTVDTTDPNLSYYYDFSQGRAEFARAFAALGHEWKWQPVTMKNYRATINRIARSVGRYNPVVMNLCDGDETNGVPGVSVIRYLEEKGLCYSGSDKRFYDVTTSKTVMKRAFDQLGVPTPSWEVIESDTACLDGIFERHDTPLIVKPAVSAGSMGITIKSVVEDEAALSDQVRELYAGYRGWNLVDGGVFVERYIKGREFTTFIIGSHDRPEACIIYPPVERVFHKALPATEQFLSFDRLWEIYERETPIGENEYLWEYQPVPPDLESGISQMSWEAYEAVGGCGYGRIDLRMDGETGELFVLEVNAQCGLSEDENHTSIGAILRFAKAPYSQMVSQIISEAQAKNASKLRLLRS